jgi:tetratricopeptide (TPR) repeat protein
MTLSNRIRRFETLIVILLAVIPASAQIPLRESLSGCDQRKALPDYLNELKLSPHSSLASYCIAEIHLQQREYQASVNAFRDALRGDGYPAWTKVWSYIQIGKVFDITDQRERAVAQYQLAIETGDNTNGAINQASELLEHPSISAHGYLSDCDRWKALPDYRSERISAPRSSLVNYCIAELQLQERDYQASVNSYRLSRAGDGDPSWTKVWSYIQIGKIFDITGQRERSVAQYQLAIQTGDNTDGAINQARELLEHPFEWPGTQ